MCSIETSLISWRMRIGGTPQETQTKMLFRVSISLTKLRRHDTEVEVLAQTSLRGPNLSDVQCSFQMDTASHLI